MIGSSSLPRKVEGLVLDLDGTLIDSQQDIADALNQTFRQVGYDPLPMDTIAGFVGKGIRPLITSAVEAAGGSDSEEEVLTIFRANYRACLLHTTSLYDGVAETLHTLSKQYPLGLSTNKSEFFTRPIIEGLHIAHYFGDAVFAGDTLKVFKPDPASLLRIGELFAVAPAGLLMVGDSEVDIITGKRAGSMTVGVTYGFRTVEELVAAGADLLIDSFGELGSLLETTG